MKSALRSLNSAKKCRSLVVSSRTYRAANNDPSSFGLSEIGQLYEIPREKINQLSLGKTMPSPMQKQINTLGELVTMIRTPLVEISTCMQAVRPSFPSIRLVLWGQFGTGKTITLNQAVHLASTQDWIIVHLQSAMMLTRKVSEVEMSTHHAGRINDPVNAVLLLQHFKQQNEHIWKRIAELKTEKEYVWSKTEKTAADRPITDIVEMGISAPFVASDCLGALFRELKRHSTAGEVKVLVALDDANSLWGKTLVKRADRTYAPPSDLTLVNHYRGLIKNDWTNGCVLLVADKKEVSDARDKLTVPRNTPLELFGEEGFEHIEPFIPVETTGYTKSEMDNIYQYYYDKRWISSAKGRSASGKEQMMYISAANPFYYERLCAFN